MIEGCVKWALRNVILIVRPKNIYGKVKKRLQEFTNALDGSNPLYTALGFSVKRNVGFNRAGKFVYFSYGVVAVNRFDGSIRNVTNSATLNNNIIINELKRNYKDRLESALGGLR